MNPGSFCGICGAVVKQGGLYCGSCGAPTAASRTPTAVPVPPPTMVGTIGGVAAADPTRSPAVATTCPPGALTTPPHAAGVSDAGLVPAGPTPSAGPAGFSGDRKSVV